MYRLLFFVNFATLPVVPGSYGQYCPIARGLDVLGDRWTLLVVRELGLGPQRFTDLRRNLDGIPPNVLSQRLKRLVEHGLAVVEELPPPAARSVYALTERGREALPVLLALARFGVAELEPATPDRTIEPARVIPGLFLPFFDEAEARALDVDEHYDVVIDAAEPRHLSSRQRALWPKVLGPAMVTLAGPGWALARLRQGESLDDLTAAGTLTIRGAKSAQSRFRRLYALT